MKTLNHKLQCLKNVIEANEPVTVMIIGLGSVGLYLLDYLIGLGDENIRIAVAGRNADKMRSDVNIVKTAAAIRGCLRSEIELYGCCDLEDVASVADTIQACNPDIIVNTSRVYAGLKYGSISWDKVRAYGIWAPLSMRYARNIMAAYEMAGSTAITINTSYSDAVIPWLKSAGMSYFDFGSGNLNHLIPRIKFYISDKYAVPNVNDIDVTLAVSHFHDVVISKEGHAEGQDVLLDIKYGGDTCRVNKSEVFAACKIPMPTDQKRNMMNASSNFHIITAVVNALRRHRKIKIHSPGVNGEIGGYPFIIDGTGTVPSGYIDQSVFSMDAMRKANRESIALDGIEKIEDGTLYYTDALIQKAASAFGVKLPESVPFGQIDDMASFFIQDIISKQIAQ